MQLVRRLYSVSVTTDLLHNDNRIVAAICTVLKSLQLSINMKTMHKLHWCHINYIAYHKKRCYTQYLLSASNTTTLTLEQTIHFKSCAQRKWFSIVQSSADWKYGPPTNYCSTSRQSSMGHWQFTTNLSKYACWSLL